MRIYLLALLVLAFFVPTSAYSQNPFRRARICIDNTKDRVVIKTRCKAPRFTEVTPSVLNDAATLSGISSAQYTKNVQVINETFSVNLTSTDDSTGQQVFCPDGSIVTGGGVSIIDNIGLAIRRSIPRTDLTAWSGSVTATRSNSSGTLSIYAICAEATASEDS